MGTFASKPLGKQDTSAFDFLQDMSRGEPTFSVNFEGFYWDSEQGRYHLIELLKCEERQSAKHDTTPWNSDPNRYWHLNWRKFVEQWHAVNSFAVPAQYTLINYAEAGTKFENMVRILEVENIDARRRPHPVKYLQDRLVDRATAREYFAELNRKSKWITDDMNGGH